MTYDPRDDAMREIEAALDEFESYHRDQWQARSHDDGDARRTNEARAKALALIRSKLPQPISMSRADDLDEWRRRNADDPGNIAVAVELDQSRTVPGMAFVVTEHDGTVTRFVPEKLPQADAKPIDKPRSLLELHGLGQGIDHRDPGAWGDDDDRFRANEEHERAVEAWAASVRSSHLVEGALYEVQEDEVEEALRLMRARPASDWERRFYALADKVKCRAPSCGDIDCGLGEIDDKLQAAGELLRAAKEALPYVETIHDSEALGEAIAKAERAGIKP